jgi:hypothetical protein
MTIIAAVLKTGGRYTLEHVRLLEDQLGHEYPLTLYTDDVDELKRRGSFGRPLSYMLPGWWSKMELFNPRWQDDIIYFDLDTVIRRRPRILLDPVFSPMMLRDFNYPNRIQSSIMAIPGPFKRFIWERWMQHPQEWMDLYNPDGLGDQAFLQDCSKKFWGILQDKYPGEYASWKVDNLKEGVPPSTRVIVFHGDPKPWDIRDGKRVWEV